MSRRKTNVQISLLIASRGCFRIPRAIRRIVTKHYVAVIVFALAATMVFIRAEPLVAETGQNPTVEASLRYSEPAEQGTEAECEGDGMTGNINCVAVKIEGAKEADGSNTTMATATLILSLRPKLTVLEDGTFITSLKGSRGDVFGFGGGSLTIIGNMKPGSRTAVEQESQELRNRLKHWKLSLNEQQIDALLSEGTVNVPVRRPFEHLKKLRLKNPPVSLELHARVSLDCIPCKETFTAREDVPDFTGFLEREKKQAVTESEKVYKRANTEETESRKRRDKLFFSEIFELVGDLDSGVK